MAKTDVPRECVECAFVLWHDYRDRLIESERESVLRVSQLAVEKVTLGDAVLMQWLFGQVVEQRT